MALKPIWPDEINHPILKNWLKGTTCHNYWIGRSVIFENTDYIVLKHNSHTSYCGRFSGSRTCKSYVALYRKADLAMDATGYSRNLFIGVGSIKRWEGRISKGVVRDECRSMGILFEAQPS
ncbi:MAG: hypothetical protein KAX55_01565 [Propionivibrio sp.]|nr:hypothetical protein [Propionivibrio sp.]